MATFYELFAGIGLVRDAIEPLGWRCVFSNDIDATKAAIYRRRFPDRAHLQLGDVRAVSVRGLPPPDLITASFPCIDLSLAGNREGLAGKHSTTFWGLIGILHQLAAANTLPKALLIENVVGFLSSHDGDDLREAVAAINAFGYLVDVVQLSAQHFTPQSRPRLFLLAFREDLGEHITIRPAARLRWSLTLAERPELRPAAVQAMMRDERLRWCLAPLPAPPSLRLRLGDVLDAHAAEWWDDARVGRALDEMSPLTSTKIQAMLQAPGRNVATAYRRTRMGRAVYEVRSDGLAGCLRTARGGSSKQIVLVAEQGALRMRWMTPLEYARLQGVPDSTALVEFSDNDLRTAFGDAVCVPAVRWLADHAFSSLLPGHARPVEYVPRQLYLSLYERQTSLA